MTKICFFWYVALGARELSGDSKPGLSKIPMNLICKNWNHDLWRKNHDLFRKPWPIKEKPWHIKLLRNNYLFLVHFFVGNPQKPQKNHRTPEVLWTLVPANVVNTISWVFPGPLHLPFLSPKSDVKQIQWALQPHFSSVGIDGSHGLCFDKFFSLKKHPSWMGFIIYG